MVDANRSPEDAELADAIERLGSPRAITLSAVAACAEGTFRDWLTDRKNSRTIPHRLEAVGYVPVRKEGPDGRWKIRGRNVVAYARKESSLRDRLEAVAALARTSR
jgi:hypothetical protein